ncbi:Armadillo-type fold containing protein [Cryptosporidium felis]|nr:Armadillo-type fold containing protein [Cryptosporidium felis]
MKTEKYEASEDLNKSQEMMDSDHDPSKAQTAASFPESSSNPVVGEILNHRIFPPIGSLSMGMLQKLRKHISFVISSNDVFSSYALRDSFWNAKATEFLFQEEIHDCFLGGFLDSILSGMSRLMLPQTLFSVPNVNLQNKINGIPLINREARLIPSFLLELEEMEKIRELLVFKFTTKDEVTEKNDLVIKYLESGLDKKDAQNEDMDEDAQVSSRLEERNYDRDDREVPTGSCKEEEGNTTEMEVFKSSKKRKLNIDKSSRVIWTRDTLMDLLILALIEFGSKSPSHTKRLFKNYKRSILGLNLIWGEESSIESSKSCDSSQHPLFESVNEISEGMMNCGLFRDSLKLIIGDVTSSSLASEFSCNSLTALYRDTRFLSILLTIWGWFSDYSSEVNLGYSFQKIKNLVLIAIDEEILSPIVTLAYFGCILSSQNISRQLDLSLNKNRYQVFMDIFELILDILNRMKVKEEDTGPTSSATQEHGKKEGTAMEDGKQNPIQSLSLESIVMVLVCIFLAGSRDLQNREIDKMIPRILDDSVVEICLRFGQFLKDFFLRMSLDGEPFKGIAGLDSVIKAINDVSDFSLDSIFTQGDSSSKLAIRWVSSSKIW